MLLSLLSNPGCETVVLYAFWDGQYRDRETTRVPYWPKNPIIVPSRMVSCIFIAFGTREVAVTVIVCCP